MSEVILGLGNASGMFYHAPAGTALPIGPFEQLPEAWKHVGDITDDGISLTMDKSTEDLKNWANKVKRTILTDHSESISAPVMDTTEETMKVLFGTDNVKVTAAASGHGKLVNVNISSSALPNPEAFLFLMKDGDTGVMIGCTKGQITGVDNVGFAPNTNITWTGTVKGLENGWTIVFDDGTKA